MGGHSEQENTLNQLLVEMDGKKSPSTTRERELEIFAVSRHLSTNSMQ